MANTGYKSVYKYRKKTYDFYQLQLPKGTRAKVVEIAKTKNYKSLNAYILHLVEIDTGLDLVLSGSLPHQKMDEK